MIQLRRNVLIFHQAALGDFVLTWPIAMACARLWPTNRIIYVTHAGKGALAERAIGTEYRDGESLHPLYSANAKLPEPARKLLTGAATIISFVSNGSDAWAQNIRELAPEAKLIFVSPRPAGDVDQHIVTFHAGQFGADPQLQAAIGQMISHIAANGATARRTAGKAVLVHPGSGGSDKCWPADRFIELVTALNADGHEVRVALGEVERERWSPEAKHSIAAAATVYHPDDLTSLYALLQSAQLYIGNDSGPTHLAALSGVPTLALYGRDNEVTWRPLGPNVSLIKHVPIDELPVEPVLVAARELLRASTESHEIVPAADEE